MAKKVRRRKSPKDDADRLSESFQHEFKSSIATRESFDEAYDDYIGENKTEFTQANRDYVWGKYQKSNYHKEALRKFEKHPSSQTPQYAARPPPKKPVRKYEYLGEVKGKNTYLYKTSITVNYKSGSRTITVYRDNKGHYGRVKS